MALLEGRAMRSKVLLVDDDESICKSVIRTLEAFDVTCEPDPVRLLLRLQAGEVYDAIILDQQMPTMNGTQLYAQLARRFPQQAGSAAAHEEKRDMQPITIAEIEIKPLESGN